MVAGACVVARVVHGCWGACMVAGGHVWLLGGVWLPGGVCGGLSGAEVCVVAGEHAVLGVGGHVWLLGVACMGYDEIWSMNKWYASYWNAFL